MGFGGGGSGSFVLPNHKHTNVLLDGGELEELVSLVDGATLNAWLAAKLLLIAPTNQSITLSGDFTTVSTTVVDVTGMSLTVANRSNGKYIFNALIDMYCTSAGADCEFRLMHNATAQPYARQNQGGTGGIESIVNLPLTGNLDGAVVKLQCKTSAGTLAVRGSANHFSWCEVLEVST
jgi:hypothetical protein